MEAFPSDEVLHASILRFLIEGKVNDAASVLLACQIHATRFSESSWSDDEVTIIIKGPRAAYDIFRDVSHPITKAVEEAIIAVLPFGTYFGRIIGSGQLVDNLDPNWMDELIAIARGQDVHNQLANQKTAHTWNNLRFRSNSELKIAQALDRACVLFLPNCLGRLGQTMQTRQNREADFLICSHGRWGILEIDGEPFHPPSRTVEDHERDRLFHFHGIHVIEHYDARICFNNPDKVVKEFIEMLVKL